MKEFTVVGRPNCGKTLFTLNFAAFLGAKTVDITFRSFDGCLNCRHYSIAEAKRELCGSQLHKTRQIQSLILPVAVKKSAVKFKLNDTCGITENIDSDKTIRQGMAQTLSLIRGSDYIIHIVDLAKLNTDENNIDYEIYRYGLARNRYVLLANKIDLPAAKTALTQLSEVFTQAHIVPISALYSEGFQAVKAYVATNV